MEGRKKEKTRQSGFKMMFKIMGSCMKGKKNGFDCRSMMENMMKDENGDALNCRSMMERMMKDCLSSR